MKKSLESTVLRLPLAAAILVATALPGIAETPKPNPHQLINAQAIDEIRKWTDTEIVRVAVNAQNARIGDIDQAEIDRILDHGAERAREIAAPILSRTYEIVGMVGAGRA